MRRGRRLVVALAALPLLSGLVPGASFGSPSTGPHALSGHPAAASPIDLRGGVAIAPDDVWVVGTTSDTGVKTVARHWDGSTWSSVRTPSPCGGINLLSDVDAVSSTDVWAVGKCGSITLAEHWDGTRWSVVDTPHVGGSDQLVSVSVINAHDVWAAGWSFQPKIQGFLEHWDGHMWTVVGAQAQQIFGVGAVSDTDVWSTMAGEPVNWNGSEWSSGQLLGGSIEAVEAIAADDVWVAGTITSRPSNDFTAHWDGSAWTEVLTPSGPGLNNGLRSITAVSSSDVWATGHGVVNGSGTGHVLHWNGTKWRVMLRHTEPAGNIAAVAATGPKDAWAFGPLGGFDTPVNAAHWNGTKWKRYAIS